MLPRKEGDFDRNDDVYEELEKHGIVTDKSRKRKKGDLGELDHEEL